MIAIDLRGHGESERDPTSAYRPESYVDEVVRVPDAKQVADALVVGHATGALVAIRMAALHPDRVRGLFLEEHSEAIVGAPRSEWA